MNWWSKLSDNVVMQYAESLETISVIDCRVLQREKVKFLMQMIADCAVKWRAINCFQSNCEKVTTCDINGSKTAKM